jgi:hypothetical protein
VDVRYCPVEGADAMSPQSFLAELCELGDPFASKMIDVPADLRAAAVALFDRGQSSVLEWRAEQAASLFNIRSALVGWDERLRERMPSTVRAIAGSSSPALIGVLVDGLGWPDRDLLRNWVRGFDVVGHVPDSHLFRPGGVSAAIAHSDFVRGNDAFNAELDARLARRGRAAQGRGGDELAALQAIKAKTVAERDAGLCAGPFSLAELRSEYGSGFRAMERFAVSQSGKLRVCDNARSSGHNAATSTEESLTVPTASLPAAIALCFQEISAAKGEPPVDMVMGTDDLHAAYRMVPNGQPAYSIAALWDPQTRAVTYYVLYGHCFGQMSAVLNFNRLPAFMCFVARAVFAACVAAYFDDYVVVEPEWTVAAGASRKRRRSVWRALKSRPASGQAALGALHSLVGLPLADAKHVRASGCCDWIGITTDLSAISSCDQVRLRPTAGRVRKLSAALAEHLQSGRMTRAQASTLHGKLAFAFSTHFGRVGRGLLQALVEFQSGATSQTVDAATRDALECARRLITSMPDAIIPTRPEAVPPAVLLTDASWEGGSSGLGAVLVAPRGAPEPAVRLVADCIVPAEVIAALRGPSLSDHIINQLEVLAAVLPLESAEFAACLRGRTVIFAIDNQAAMFALIKGRSRDARMSRLANMFWLAAARLGIRPWFVYVPSGANWADAPSRGAVESVIAAGFDRILCAVPPLRGWTEALRSAESVDPSAGQGVGI